MRAQLSIILAFMLMACGPAHGRRAIMMNQMSVIIVNPVTPIEMTKILRAAKLHVETLEADFGVKLPPTNIFVLRGLLNSCGGNIGPYAGCNPGSVYVWTGPEFACDALYHELAHTILGEGHVGPTWVAVDKRSAEIVAQLRTS